MGRLVACLSLIVMSACGPNAGCLDACEELGIERDGPRCREVCTEDCSELVETYGMNLDHCEEMQAGRL